MPSVATKASTCATSTSTPLMSPTKPGAGDDQQDRERPGDAVFDLKADRENVPHHDAEADGQIDAAGHHRQGRGEREHRDDRFVGEDRAEVEPGRKRVRQQDREQDDQQQRQHRQAIDRQQPQDRLPRRQRGEFGPRRLQRVRLDRLHRRASFRCARRPRSILADAAASRLLIERSSACSSLHAPGRDRTPARDGRPWRSPRNRWRR